MKADAVRKARVIQVIETVALKGEGVSGDPAREVTQYWSLNGGFLAERDPLQVKLKETFAVVVPGEEKP